MGYGTQDPRFIGLRAFAGEAAPMQPRGHCVIVPYEMYREDVVAEHGNCPGYPYTDWVAKSSDPYLITTRWCCEQTWEPPPHRVTCEEKCQGDWECEQRCLQMEGWLAPKTKPQPYRPPKPRTVKAAKAARIMAIKHGR